MKRRAVLASLGPSIAAVAGCAEASESDRECTDLDRLQIDCSGEVETAFELRLLQVPDDVGDTLRVALRNASDATAHTGNRYHYDVRERTNDGWRSILRIEPRSSWTSEGVPHDPGTGFTWEFEFSADGLSRENETNPTHHVCSKLTGGDYEFAYFGLDGDECLTARFTV